MKALFVIQDIKTKEYFWEFRIEEGFIDDLTEAKTYNSEEEVEKKLQEDFFDDDFDRRILEIKKYYGL